MSRKDELTDYCRNQKHSARSGKLIGIANIEHKKLNLFITNIHYRKITNTKLEIIQIVFL